MKLNKRIEIFLNEMSGTITYTQLANIYNTSPRAIGSCMRAIARRNLDLTDKVIFTKK